MTVVKPLMPVMVLRGLSKQGVFIQPPNGSAEPTNKVVFWVAVFIVLVEGANKREGPVVVPPVVVPPVVVPPVVVPPVVVPPVVVPPVVVLVLSCTDVG